MKAVLRKAILAGLFVIPFIPLYVEYAFFFPFITGKGFAFRIIVELIAIFWIVLMCLDARYRPKFSPLLGIYGALVVWMVVANFLGVNPHKAFWSNFERMDGWITLVHVFMFFVISGSVLTVESLWRKWWRTFVGGAFLVCGYALLQLMGHLQIHQSGVRVDATVGNAAYLAAYLLFAIPITLWQALVQKGWMRYALIAVTLLEVVILFATATRGALIGFVVAVFAGLVYALLLMKGKVRMVLGALLVGAIVTVGLFVAFKDTAYIAEDPTLSRIASISAKELGVRFTLWNMALEGGLERPITGWGQEGFNYIYNKNYAPELYAQEPWFDRAHNVYLDWFVAGGVPAVTLFFMLLGYALYALTRTNIPRLERILLTSALVGYGVQGLVVFDNLLSYIPLAAVLAMIHGMHAKPIAFLEKMKEADSQTINALILPIVLPVGFVLLYLVNVPSMLSANHLIQALYPWPDPKTNVSAFEQALADNSFAIQEIREQLVVMAAGAAGNQYISPEIRLYMLNLAASEMQKQLIVNPGDARLWLQLSYIFRAGGDFASAHKAIAEARALSPVKQSLAIEEGTLFWQEKKYEDARRVFGEAYELGSQRFPELAVYVAAADARLGNIEASDALLNQHFGTTTLNRQLLIIAYGELGMATRLIPLLEERVREQPSDPITRLQLATAYADAGRNVDAEAFTRDVMREYPEPVILEMGTELLRRLK